MDEEKISVLMANEGTYPYVGGGVSTWCHILCENMADIDWHIFAVVAEPYVTDNYNTGELPQVRSKQIVPLWGFEETAEYHDERPFSQVYQSKLDTTTRVIEEKFVPDFYAFLEALESEDINMAEVGPIIHRLYRYFQRYDYNITIKSQPAWSTFRDFSMKVCDTHPVLARETTSLFDITTCMRWLYNMFIPIAARVRETTITHATIAASTAMSCIVSKFEYGTPMVLTDHGVYARERYIACSSAPFGPFAKRFLALLALLFSRLCYYYADVIAPCAHFNARWELPMGCVLPREEPIDFSTWKGTGVVPNLKEFPFIRPTYDALADLGLSDGYEETTEYPWIRTVYNGVDTEHFKPGEKPEHLQGTPTAVALARVFALKDIFTMIRSCAVVRKEIPNIKYRLFVISCGIEDETYRGCDQVNHGDKGLVVSIASCS